VIAVIGVVLAAIVANNNSNSHTALVQDNLFLLCCTVAVLGGLIVLTAAIGYALNRLDDRAGPEAPATPAGSGADDQDAVTTGEFIGPTGAPMG
jgi:hypothetical protein